MFVSSSFFVSLTLILPICRYYTFLCMLFWPFVDSYWLAALSLFSALPDRTVTEHLLLERGQWFADHLFKVREDVLIFYTGVIACNVNLNLDWFVCSFLGWPAAAL